jgi:hypothetical protein
MSGTRLPQVVFRLVYSAALLFLSSARIPRIQEELQFPQISSSWQWWRCRYDAADHPAQLGVALRRRGAA